MVSKRDDAGYVPALEGIQRRTLVHGERTLMTEFHLQRGAVLPRHSHPHEQTGYLISGRIRLTIGDSSFEVDPGDSWCIPGGAEHEAIVLEDASAIEVFCPVREDYLPSR